MKKTLLILPLALALLLSACGSQTLRQSGDGTGAASVHYTADAPFHPDKAAGTEADSKPGAETEAAPQPVGSEEAEATKSIRVYEVFLGFDSVANTLNALGDTLNALDEAEELELILPDPEKK